MVRRTHRLSCHGELLYGLQCGIQLSPLAAHCHLRYHCNFGFFLAVLCLATAHRSLIGRCRTVSWHLGPWLTIGTHAKSKVASCRRRCHGDSWQVAYMHCNWPRYERTTEPSELLFGMHGERFGCRINWTWQDSRASNSSAAESRVKRTCGGYKPHKRRGYWTDPDWGQSECTL